MCRKKFKDEIALLVHKAKRKWCHGISAWVENFRYDLPFFPFWLMASSSCSSQLCKKVEPCKHFFTYKNIQWRNPLFSLKNIFLPAGWTTSLHMP
jgi:hypothetical protein